MNCNVARGASGSAVFVAVIAGLVGSIPGVRAEHAMAQTPVTAPEAQHGQRTDPRDNGSGALATATAVGATRAPAIDGSDADAIWATASPITAFRVWEPVEDGEPAFGTEARIAFDARNIYVLVRAFDPRPDSIVSLLSRRDVRTTSDQIRISIDAFNDRRTGFDFAVNPAGVKLDYYNFDDGAQDLSWDGVWDVATRIDSLGWTAEFRIPVSQLRYSRAESHVFGLMIQREVARTNEKVSWPVYRRSQRGYASQFGEVTGLRDLAAPRRLEVSPYVLARNRSEPSSTGFGRAQEQTVGADAKVGIGPNLTLDAAINPDFGQVEADPAVLNLSAFEQQFEERRPFFVEGAGIFRFGVTPSRMFYSRRIGRGPQLAGLAPDPDAVPTSSTILGAAKLSGRLGGGLSLGALGALTQREAAGGVTVEPRTFYGLARATRDFHRGESAIGGMLTTVRRDLDTPLSVDLLRRDAMVGGVDARHRFAGGTYQLRASLIGSVVRGSAPAIARTQRSSARYFQRPDDGLEYDSTRTSLNGGSFNFVADKRSGTLTGAFSYERVSPGLETNDIGFMSRADRQTAYIYGTLESRKPSAFWRRASVTAQGGADWSVATGLPIWNIVELDGSVEFPSGHTGSLSLWSQYLGTAFDDRASRGGPAVRLSPDISALLNLRRDPRKAVSPQIAAIYTVADGGHSHLWRVRPYVTIRSGTRMSTEFGTRYQHNFYDVQWYANAVAGGATQHLFARLDQRLLSFTGRMNMTMSPEVSLQLYAEPFVTTGRYSNVRALSATPRAKPYGDRYAPFALGRDAGGFNEKQLRSNAVLRWEYRPGSTLFFVWQQGRDQSGQDAGSFEATRDYGNLFRSRPDNTFLIKGSYWLSL